MAIFMACVYVYVIILVMIGPEQRKVDHIKERLDEPIKEDGSYLEKVHEDRTSEQSMGKTIG